MLSEGLHILPTHTTPEIILKPNGTIKVKGRSDEKKFDNFSKQVLDWANLYVTDPAEITNIDINLEYIDETHSANLLAFLRKISEVQLKGKRLVIKWTYNGDEKNLEKGMHFSEELKVPFNFVLIS